MCQPQHNQFIQSSSSTSSPFINIHHEQDDDSSIDDKKKTMRFREMNKSLTMQYAQGFALLLVVFTYVRRSGTTSNEQISLHAVDECPAPNAPASNDIDIYFPGSSWAIPYFIVGVYCMMRFTKLIGQGIEKLQQQRRRTVVHIQANLRKVPSREALSRISSQVSSLCKSISTTCNNNINQLATLSSKNQIPAITSSVCFARSDYIEELSAIDISTIFQYATLINQDIFDRKTFISKQNKLIRGMLTAMDVAVQLSRGSSATHYSREQQLKQRQQQQQHPHQEEQEGRPSCLQSSPSGEGHNDDNEVFATGDMDALYFVAAARIFAEWRVLRLVPPGYKRYAFSINLARRDMLQNLTHIENAVHGYLKQIQQSRTNDFNLDYDIKILTPTLRALLQYEIHTLQMHKKLPFLDGDSAALGLLWTKRQIEYQIVTFANTLDVPTQFRTTKDAALAAYEAVYKPYHGWAVQQVFKSSFGSSPPIDDIWRYLDPPIRLLNSKKENENDEKRDSNEYLPPQLLSHLSSSNDWGDSDDENLSNDSEPENELAIALDEIGKNLVGAWDETMQFLSRFVCVAPDNERHHRGRNLIMSHESYLQMSKLLDPTLIDTSELILSESDSNDDITDEVFQRSNSIAMPIDETSEQFSTSPAASQVINVLQKVKTNVRDHINAMKPMVEGWDCLIMELNMNDPRKV